MNKVLVSLLFPGIVFLGLLIFSSNVRAQVKIGDNPDSIDQNSLLELESITKGFLYPRMTTAQRSAMTAPIPPGMAIYNVDSSCIEVYDTVGTGNWKNLCDDSDGLDHDWHKISGGADLGQAGNIGDSIYTNGRVGIQTLSPFTRLQVGPNSGIAESLFHIESELLTGVTGSTGGKPFGATEVVITDYNADAGYSTNFASSVNVLAVSEDDVQSGIFGTPQLNFTVYNGTGTVPIVFGSDNVMQINSGNVSTLLAGNNVDLTLASATANPGELDGMKSLVTLTTGSASLVNGSVTQVDRNTTTALPLLFGMNSTLNNNAGDIGTAAGVSATNTWKAGNVSGALKGGNFSNTMESGTGTVNEFLGSASFAIIQAGTVSTKYNGSENVAQLEGGTVSSKVVGALGRIEVPSGKSPTVTDTVIGVEAVVKSEGSPTVAAINGIRSAINIDAGSPTITSGSISGVLISSNDKVGVATTMYGLNIQTISGTAAGNVYGVFIDDKIDASGSGNEYGVYQAGALDVNYFAGNVGIGCNDPKYPLHVAGDIAAEGGTLRASSAVISTSITTCSDIRYKKNISPLQSSLHRILNIQGVKYDWKVKDFPEKGFTNDRQIGFIAQDLEKILPEVVQTDAEGYKTVDYSRLTPLLVEAIKELKADLEEKEQMIENLRAEIDQKDKNYDNLRSDTESLKNDVDDIRLLLEMSGLKASSKK